VWICWIKIFSDEDGNMCDVSQGCGKPCIGLFFDYHLCHPLLDPAQDCWQQAQQDVCRVPSNSIIILYWFLIHIQEALPEKVAKIAPPPAYSRKTEAQGVEIASAGEEDSDNDKPPPGYDNPPKPSEAGDTARNTTDDN
jgi:hypothetical protein